MQVAIAETARHLVTLSEQRQEQTAPVLDPPRDAYERFCAGFPYRETADQITATEAVLADLKSGRPMDRLVVGDVGYGKTEVALRAAAACALSGSQVAIAAPTSVLARQHFETFSNRFAGTDIKVAMLSRLTPAADAKAIRQGLADGTVHVVVGTSAVGAKSVEYASCALVVIDEEQRFGTRDKEMLRAVSGGHCLSLSATPIPRSLQAALVGLQDLSILATPPARRQPVITRIAEFDANALRTILLREKGRRGQSFVVVPRISDIGELEGQLASLVPELTVVTAHGKMTAAELDDAMVGFSAGRGDVLLATNIIEAGLDVPRANAMIVMQADRFGLAQLHQLRGRVGRGRRQGGITLMTATGQQLAPHTAKRLSTLAAFDSLGAGFAVSASDLDMRGSGDLAGEGQTGHANLIGADLYQYLLEGAVREARGDQAKERWTPRLNAGITGCLPAEWIGDEDVRVGLYARASRIESNLALREFADELRDRFGRPPATAMLFLRTIGIRLLARGLGIDRIDAGPGAIALSPRPGVSLDLDGLARVKDRFVLKEQIADPGKRLKRTQAVLSAIRR